MILPIETKIHTASFHSQSFPLSIIQTHQEYKKTWVCDKMINFVYHPTYLNQFMIYNTDWHFVACGALREYEQIFHKPILDHMDVIGFVKDALTNGLYVSGQWNERYIPRKTAYHTFDRMHEFLLYGYDEVEQVLFFVGYLDHTSYKKYRVRYQDFINALFNIQDSALCVSLFRLSEHLDCRPDNDKMMHGLRDYYESKDTVRFDADGVFGLKALDCFIREMENAMGRDSKNIDQRYVRSFFEHKQMMQIRMLYLFEKGYITQDAYQQFQAIAQCAYTVHLLAVKHQMTKEKELFCHIIDLIKTCQDKEKNWFAQNLFDCHCIDRR